MFDIIYADPPWEYDCRQHSGPGGADTGAAEDHYSTLTFDQMAGIDVSSLCARDCLLFMWTTGPMMAKAVALIDAWGFDYATVAFVWNKLRVNPGNYTMSQCEYVLLGKRGRVPSPRGLRNVRQYVEHPRMEHSRKPDSVRDAITVMFPSQRKIEMFARRRADGWSAWGNEVDCDIFLRVSPRGRDKR